MTVLHLDLTSKALGVPGCGEGPSPKPKLLGKERGKIRRPELQGNPRKIVKCLLMAAAN